VDFRFGKQLSGERTFTICGMADSLAPEIVLGKGHGFPADWYKIKPCPNTLILLKPHNSSCQ